MTQTGKSFLDDITRLMTDAAGVAQGFGKEMETAIRSRAESFVGDMDFVKREEFEAVRDMASKAREENERLAHRIADLEARLAKLEGGKSDPSVTLIAGDPSGPTVG